MPEGTNEEETMAAQPPDRPLPPSSLWDAIPDIISRLRDEFLLVTVAYLLILVAIGLFAPNVVDLLGRFFFYLIVVLAFVAYVFGRVLPVYVELRERAGPAEAGGQGPSDPQSSGGGSPGETRNASSERDLRDRYLDSLISKCCRARLVGLDPQASDPARSGLSLEHLYVSPDTLTPAREDLSEGAERLKEASDSAHESRTLSALEALCRVDEGRMVLLGLPGAGKSTFVRHLALRMAQALRDPGLRMVDLLPDWQGRPLLPLIVSLGRLAESLPSEAKRGDAEMIEHYVCRVFDADERLRGYGETLLAWIRREGGIILFDGLDEVADLELRPVVREAVEDFADRYGGNSATRFMVSCRTYSYTDDRWQLTGWPTHEIAPWDEGKIHQFVKAWHAELSRVDPARAEDYAHKCQKMLRALDPSDRRRLAETAPNPLILTVMVVVHTHRGELPDARALVYEECVDLLLVRWEMERPVLGQRVRKRTLLDALGVPRITLDNALQELAYRAHEGGSRPGAVSREDQAALVTEDLITGVLQSNLNDLEKVATFLTYCESANGLVMLQGTAPLPDAPPDAPPRRVFAFPHMTFEEYLAGRYLGRLRNPAGQVREHVDLSDRWREPVMFLGEYLCFRTGDFERMDAILDRLVPAAALEDPASADWRAGWLAGDLLMLYRRALQGRPECDERVVTRLCCLVETGVLTARERAAAARTLGVLGDPRPGLAVDGATELPDLQWCLVPPGPFLMGSRKEDDPQTYDDETPQHTYEVAYPYAVARYPITNAQFQPFVDDSDGYRADRWWTGAGLAWRQERRGPQMRGGVYDLGNHPAVMITWYEAVAWCRWVSRRMQRIGALPDGWEVRLPSEAEWEKAARGGPQIPEDPVVWRGDDVDPVGLELAMAENPLPARRYPWGDDADPKRANYAETGIGTTCAVGIFPYGSSPYGCLDLSGNVWEWCATKWVETYEAYGDKEDNGLEGDARRVVRGGAFYDLGGLVRCAVRSWYNPDLRYWNRGFRPVVAPVDSGL